MEIAELARLVALVSAALLLGSMLFFAAVVTPTAFAVGDTAGRLLPALFPRYYAWGIALALVAAVAAFRVDGVAAIVLSVVTVLFVFLRQILLPNIRAAKDARGSGDAGAGRRFRLLHLSSVLINLAQMVAVAAVVVRLGAFAPR